MHFCNKCDGRCCQSYYVRLSIPDLAIISGKGKNGFYAIVESQKPDEYSFLCGSKRYDIILKLKNGKCIFFSSRNGCTIYKQRPASCGLYPFSSEDVMEMMVHCACPNHVPPPKEADVAEAREWNSEYRRRWGIHKELVQEWDRSPFARIPFKPLFIHYALNKSKIKGSCQNRRINEGED